MSNEIYDIYGKKIELTKEQQACVNYSGDRTLLVKGLAGSGKSIAIMQIAQKYLSQTESSNTLAFFSFANTFCQSVREFFENNETEQDRVNVTTLAAHVTHVYHAIGGPKVKIYTDKLYDQKRMEVLQEAIDFHREHYGPHRFHELELKFWLEEFSWMKGMNVSEKDLGYYLTLPRKGRGNGVRMTHADRLTAFQIYAIYEEKRKTKLLGDWDDMTLFVIRNADKIQEDHKFDLVLIDEAQDLSLAEMLAAKCFSKKSMVVAMDMNQRIYDNHWTPKQLGIETTTKKLTTSMRTTIQIDALAESIRSRNDAYLDEDDRSLRAKPIREGQLPRLIHLSEVAQEKKFVTEQIRVYLENDTDTTIGVLASKNRQIDTYAAWMTDAGILHEIITPKTTFSMSKPGVKIINVHNAKGLEFDRVIIPQFIEGYFPYKTNSKTEEELNEFLIKCRNITYVAMTRAKQTLLITYAGHNSSRFIADMDSDYYEFVDIAPTGDDDDPVVDDLASFFKGKGLEVVDKRPSKGALWVVGEKDAIQHHIKEACALFGAGGKYSEKGGRATGHRPGWFTHCKR